MTNKKTILLVEDEVTTATVGKMGLEKYGYNVISANTGEFAIETVESFKGIDLILMDIDLGDGMDGTEAAAIILKTHDLPVVFLSSHTEPEIVEKTEKITSYGYVVKNSGITVLDASIKMALKLFDANQKIKTTINALEATLDALPDQLFETGLDGSIYDYHAPNTGSWHNPVSDMIGKKISDIFSPIVSEIIMSAIQEAQVNGFSSGKQFQMTAPDGTLWFEVFVSGKDYNTDNPHFIILKRDITESKRVEETMRESEEKYRLLVQESPDAIALYADGKIIFVNRATIELMRAKTEVELIGKSVIDFVHPDYRGFVRKRVMKAMNAGKLLPFAEEKFIRLDGTEVYVEVKAIPILLEGKVVVQLIIRDISDRKRAEESLRKSEEDYRKLFDDHGAVKIIIDPETGNIKDVNTAAEKYYGWPREVMMKMNIEQINTLPIEEIKDAMRKANVRKQIHFEFKHKKADGSIRDVDVFSNGINMEGKRYLHSIIFDITDRKFAEEEIKRQLAEKETILKEVHHRIKNNIDSIEGFLILQTETISNAEALSALHDAIGRVHSMKILYEKLLYTDDYKKISIKQYVESICDTIFGLFPNNPKIVLEKKIDEFKMNAQRIFPIGVIINELITNAMKHSFINRDAGLININLSNNNNQVSLVIQDNGNGLPDGFNINESKGFGLMLVKMMNKQINGSYVIENNNGTRFILKFQI